MRSLAACLLPPLVLAASVTASWADTPARKPAPEPATATPQPASIQAPPAQLATPTPVVETPKPPAQTVGVGGVPPSPAQPR